MTHSWNHLHYWLFAILMLMCSLGPTNPLKQPSSFSLSFNRILPSLSVCLFFCQPLHPPTYSSIVPQLPFLSAAVLPCLPLGKEMRRGTDANILDPLLLPDSSPRDRNKDGMRKRGVNGGIGGGARWLDGENISSQSTADGTRWKKTGWVQLCEAVYCHAVSFLG